MTGFDELSNKFIDDFDFFLDIEEREHGCLSDEDHQRLTSDRNDYIRIFQRTLRRHTPSSHQQASEQLDITLLPHNDDDNDDNSPDCSISKKPNGPSIDQYF